MPDGGKLTIETSNAYLDDEYCRQHAGVEPGQYVLIAVTDNGVGMDRDDRRSRVRAVLHHQGGRQGHRARPEPGLRLRQAVRRAREDLQRARRGHDRQALSAALRRRGDDRQRAGGPGGAERGRGETILVVEDDDGVRQYAAEILRDLNYQVIEAQAIRPPRCGCWRPTSRSTCCSPTWCCPARTAASWRTRSLRRRPGVKVIFMTGYSRNAIVHQGRLDPRHRADLQAADRGHGGAQNPPGARRLREPILELWRCIGGCLRGGNPCGCCCSSSLFCC